MVDATGEAEWKIYASFLNKIQSHFCRDNKLVTLDLAVAFLLGNAVWEGRSVQFFRIVWGIIEARVS